MKTDTRVPEEPSLYEADVIAWANRQAALLRAGRFDELDIEHIADESSSDWAGIRSKRSVGGSGVGRADVGGPTIRRSRRAPGRASCLISPTYRTAIQCLHLTSGVTAGLVSTRRWLRFPALNAATHTSRTGPRNAAADRSGP